MSEGFNFEDLAKAGAKGKSDADAELHIKIQHEAWAALNSWVRHGVINVPYVHAPEYNLLAFIVNQITKTLKSRKGIHIPSLCRMTWENVNRNGGEVRI